MNIEEFVDPNDVRRYITFHKALNPKLWDGDRLRLEVRVKLLAIALQFYKFLQTPGLVVRDVIMTGSNAAYNYTPLSDVDVHIIVDFESSTCPDLADNFFNTKKNLWNATRKVTIRGHGVELYVEDTKNPVTANGIYSLLDGTWKVEPKPAPPKYDDLSVINKTEQYADEIDNLITSNASTEDVENFVNRLRKLRQAGLAKGGEFSVENLTFKSLRNLGYLDKLAQGKLNTEVSTLSLY